jgi:ribonuclease BN (tRNA processing enzyme)
LVEAGARRLLLDCGSGVLHRMAGLGIPWAEIDDIAITHFHADHLGDLAPYIIASRYGTLPPRSAALRIVGPPGIGRVHELLGELFGSTVSDPGFPVQVVELPAGGEIDLGGGVVLRSRAVPHTDESVAYSVEYGGRRIVYTGDTGQDAELAKWARGCDILLAECSLPAEMAMATHLTPEQCGELAGGAEPGVLVLTHFYPPVELVDIGALVSAHFGGHVVLSSDGWSLELEED